MELQCWTGQHALSAWALMRCRSHGCCTCTGVGQILNGPIAPSQYALPCPSLRSLLQQEALLGQLKECPTLRDLRQLLEGLAATGHLRSLAATLLTQRTAALAAALGQVPGPAQAPQAATDGQAAAGSGADVSSAAAGTTNAGSAGAAEASGTADGGADAAPPSGATISAAQAADVVASAAAIIAAVAASPSAAQPGAAPSPSRGKAFVGVQPIGNSWMAHLTVGVDEQLRPSGESLGWVCRLHLVPSGRPPLLPLRGVLTPASAALWDALKACRPAPLRLLCARRCQQERLQRRQLWQR